MKSISSALRTWGALALLAAGLAGCGGGDGGRLALGFDPAAPAPTVAATAPANGLTGVAINARGISVNFSEPIAPLGGTATFAVTCAAPCSSPTGTTSLDATGRVATFDLTPGTLLAPSTQYTTTIKGVRSRANGSPLAVPFVSTFTTGVGVDTTRPTVASTFPLTSSPGPTAGVPANTAVTATFSEDMAPASLSSASFSVSCAAPCKAPAGTVSYDVGSRTAVFTPATPLAIGTIYTATVSTAATDFAANALGGNEGAPPAASNYVWTFATAGAAAPGNLAVQSSNPAAGSTRACVNAPINVSFSVPGGGRLDPASVNGATFTLTDPASASVPASSVVLDATTGRIATFQPAAPLAAGSVYQARVRGGAAGVHDLSVPGNGLPADVTFSFTAANCVAPASAISLASAATYGAFGGSAGITNQGILTVIHGDIGTTGVSTLITGFHDAGPGCKYTETPLNAGAVNGLIYTAPPSPTPACPSEGTAVTSARASQASADALIAFNQLAALAGGPDPGPGNLANLTLAPGVYTAADGSFRIQGGSLTLDAQGDPNATFVFQMASTLTVGGPGAAFPSSIVLANGAQARNVFWQVGSAATINAGGGGTMVGTIVARSGVTFSTAGALAVTTLNGRAISLGPVVTLVNTVINVPAP